MKKKRFCLLELDSVIRRSMTDDDFSLRLATLLTTLRDLEEDYRDSNPYRSDVYRLVYEWITDVVCSAKV